MDPNRRSEVERLLLDRIQKQLSAAGIQGVEGETLRGPMREVLSNLQLASDEERALAPGAQGPRGASPIDRFLSLRIERAIQAALEAAARLVGAPRAPVAPRVLVHRTHAGAGEAEPRAPLPAPAAETVEALAREGRGVLVLADGPMLDGFLDRYRDFRIGQAGLGLHVRSGETEDPLLTLGAHDPDAVHVLESESALAELELTLETAIRSRIDAAAEPAPAVPSTQAPTGTTPALLPPDAADIPRDPSDPLVGSLFDGKYLILRRMGTGGFGVVYEARDVRLDHRVAIKLLHPGATRSPEELEAFRSEARRATRLSHPNIVDWKTFEQSRDGVWYFVMELLEGEELDAVMKREGRMDARRTGRILLQVLDALRAAHDIGDGQAVLHLDLKPKNVFLVREHGGQGADRVKVIDFGIGQLAGAEAPQEPTTAAGETRAAEPDQELVGDAADEWNGSTVALGEQTLLSVHTLDKPYAGETQPQAADSQAIPRSTACTPEYAAPEQCAHLLPELEAVPLDGRADLYALGVIGFQMLTGQLPFEKPKRRKDLLHLKQSVEPRKVSSLGVRVPKRLAQFIDRCIARSRDARFRDANEAYEALADIVDPPLRKSLLAAAAALVIGAVATAWIVGRSFVRPGLDLYTKVGDVERSLAGGRLHLGPKRDHATLRVSGLESGAQIRGVRLVDSRDPGASEIQGFHASVSSAREVVVSAEHAFERIQHPAYLEVRSGGKDSLWSVPFELVWIGEQAWELEGLSVQGQGERALDPAGARLEIRVRGSADDIATVRVENGARSLAASRDTTLSHAEEGVYTVPLEELSLEGPTATLHALVTDCVDRTVEKSFRARLATGVLALDDASLDSTPVGGRYSISPRGDPVLRVAASRKADFTWSVRDENGGTLMQGSAQGVGDGKFPVTGLTKLRGGREFSGSIDVVADESAYVLHAGHPERGIAKKRLEFLFTNSAPEFSVRISSPGGGLGTTVDPGRPVFTSKHDLVVRVGRESPLPVMVQVVCTPTQPPGAAIRLAPQALVEREAISAEVPLSLPKDGEYDLTVRVWRHDAPGQDTSREPDALLQSTLVVDSVPATVEILGASSAIVLRSRSEPLPRVEIGVKDDDGAGRVARTPVHLRWDLVLAQRPDQPLASGVLGAALPGGAPVILEIPAPWNAGPKGPITRDGAYRLIVRGDDDAGNATSPAEVPFDAAVDGPELELARPARRVQWPRGESGAFDLQVVARDPNGVAAVHGVVRRVGAPDLAFELKASGDPRDTDLSIWTGAISFDESWSNSHAEVRLVSEDRFGTSSELAEPREIGPVDRLLPLRVAVDFGGVPVEKLHLVEGNAGSPYTFGGRVDEEEERAFSTAYLPTFNSLNTTRSWRVAYETGEVRSYYLDEHEVSIEQYLAFVRAPNGYASPANWPAGSGPDHSRMTELETQLAALPQALPIADVTWEEASAYARWVGKRLPSLVEWEFAVRGGVQYRPFAAARRGGSAPTREETNYDPEGLGDGAPWPCTQGGDITADTGIQDLCSNVAEWTATPASFLDGASTPRNLAAHVLANRVAFLDPRRSVSAESSQRFWIAGGSYRSARADFLTLDRRARGWHGPTTGFRCAADVEVATAAAPTAASAIPGKPHFRGDFE